MATSAPFSPAGPAPKVRLVNTFARPFDNAIATARTCYAPGGIVTEADVAGDGLDEAGKARKANLRDNLARSLYQAGHHTTLQHASFQFAMENVSRHFIWAFLHSHPFYNSEQVSQRYVTVAKGSITVPALEGEALRVYVDAADAAMTAYRELDDILFPVAADLYYARFRGRTSERTKYDKEVRKKSQEAARYVLPVATQAYLYHTVSGVTLLRYARLCAQVDVPDETRHVVGLMTDELLRHDPGFAAVLEEAIDLDATPEAAFLKGRPATEGLPAKFRERFDASLAGRTSTLVDWKVNAEVVLAEAVRETLGATPDLLDDDAAIALALDPAKNPLHGENLVLVEHSKILRALHHPHYTFRKKLSHTADSQDQRHRMTPASRPALCAQTDFEPDAIVPELVRIHEPARRLFDDATAALYAAGRRLVALGVAPETAAYLLPNATAVRFTESGDLAAIHHKLAMRLCYNAQEEIWKASHEEQLAIRGVHPRLGAHLGPPCDLRYRAGVKPICPEGPRYCGVPVWKLDAKDYVRVI